MNKRSKDTSLTFNRRIVHRKGHLTNVYFPVPFYYTSHGWGLSSGLLHRIALGREILFGAGDLKERQASSHVGP